MTDQTLNTPALDGALARFSPELAKRDPFAVLIIWEPATDEGSIDEFSGPDAASKANDLLASVGPDFPDSAKIILSNASANEAFKAHLVVSVIPERRVVSDS